LKATDEAEYCRHIYRRARGHGIDADTVSLLSGERAVATVMFLDLKGSTQQRSGSGADDSQPDDGRLWMSLGQRPKAMYAQKPALKARFIQKQTRRRV
jgi:hypothetical protein